MGLFFDNEEEEREKRRAAEATEQAELHRRKAAEAKLKEVEAQLEHEDSIRWEEQRREEKAQLRAMTKSGRGDAILDLLHKYEEEGKRKDGEEAEAIKQWQVPTDKTNFELFVQTFNINYDYFKELDWVQYTTMEDGTVGLREMLVEKARKVERIHLRGKVNDTMELLDEVEQKLTQEREKNKREVKQVILIAVAFVVVFVLYGLVQMCNGH